MKKVILVVFTITLIFASIIYFAFSYGTDFLSRVIADVIPSELQKQIGESTLQSMDVQNFDPSSLSLHTQNKIRQQFYQLIHKDSSNIKLVFRNANYPNAFALPGNIIVILDSLILLSKDTTNYSDVLGVLAHETGHLKYKHSLRLMIKAGLTGVIIGYLIGDVSSMVASITHQLLSLSFSRQFEEEADNYAIELLKKNNISTYLLANLLEKISSKSNSEQLPEFLSTHPVTSERIKKLKQQNLPLNN